MGKATLALIGTLAAAALIATGFWLGRQEAVEPPAEASGSPAPESDRRLAARVDTPANIAAAPAAPETPATGAEVIAVPEPLPPTHAPLADVFDELLERARRGDARAACRLASDLQRCTRSQMQPRDTRAMEDRVAGEDDDRRRASMIDFMVRMELERARTSRMCAGVTDEQLDLAFPLQMQAAQARPELRVWAALSPALDTRFFVSELERWQQYRQVAVPWLERAAAQGDLGAVIAMARIHGDDRRFGPGTPPLRQIDDVRFVSYATLMQRYGVEIPPVQRALEEARARLTPTQAADAESHANALFRPEAVVAGSPDALRQAMQRSFDPVSGGPDCD